MGKLRDKVRNLNERVEDLEYALTDIKTLLRLVVRNTITYKATHDDPLAMKPTFNPTYIEVLQKWLDQQQ